MIDVFSELLYKREILNFGLNFASFMYVIITRAVGANTTSKFWLVLTFFCVLKFWT